MEKWLEKISPVLRIVGHARHPNGWIEPLRVIYDHELVLVSRGRVLVEIEGKEYQCDENNFIIIPPGAKHVSCELDNKPCFRHWIHFSWVQYVTDNLPILSYYPVKPKENLYQLAPKFVPNKIFFGEIQSLSYVIELYARLSEKWNHGSEHDRVICRAIFLELLLELLDTHQRLNEGTVAATNIAGKARLVLEKLSRKKIEDCPSIQTALEELGYSYAHLCRMFRRVYGLTPLGYINAIRIERAKLLLRDTELTISQVADRIGFESSAYLSRLFKKQTKMTPSQFIKKTKV